MYDKLARVQFIYANDVAVDWLVIGEQLIYSHMQ